MTSRRPDHIPARKALTEQELVDLFVRLNTDTASGSLYARLHPIAAAQLERMNWGETNARIIHHLRALGYDADYLGPRRHVA
jgi:hypothetical protein